MMFIVRIVALFVFCMRVCFLHACNSKKGKLTIYTLIHFKSNTPYIILYLVMSISSLLLGKHHCCDI